MIVVFLLYPFKVPFLCFSFSNQDSPAASRRPRWITVSSPAGDTEIGCIWFCISDGSTVCISCMFFCTIIRNWGNHINAYWLLIKINKHIFFIWRIPSFSLHISSLKPEHENICAVANPKWPPSVSLCSTISEIVLLVPAAVIWFHAAASLDIAYDYPTIMKLLMQSPEEKEKIKWQHFAHFIV